MLYQEGAEAADHLQGGLNWHTGAKLDRNLVLTPLHLFIANFVSREGLVLSNDRVVPVSLPATGGWTLVLAFCVSANP